MVYPSVLKAVLLRTAKPQTSVGYHLVLMLNFTYI